MKLSIGEVQDAILNNDTTRTAEMLEEFNLTKNDTPHPYFTSDDKALAATMLSFASAMSYRDALDGALAEELIERTAMTVNIFPFAQLVVAAAEIETDDFDVIPEEIRAALRKNDCTDKIAHAIEELDSDVFAALLAFLITGEIERVHVKFNLPIMRYIHAEETIPVDLMFTYMALCPRKTIDEYLGDLNDTLGALDALTMLDVLAGEIYDDENHECYCGGHHGECDGCYGCHSDD